MSDPHAPIADSLRPVVIYDGNCPFCRKQIKKIRNRDRDGLFDYQPRDTPGLENRFPALATADFNTGMRLAHPDGSILVGADAVHGIASKLPLWRCFAWLYRLPLLKQVCRAGYGWIAANRQKLGRTCDDGTCEIQ